MLSEPQHTRRRSLDQNRLFRGDALSGQKNIPKQHLANSLARNHPDLSKIESDWLQKKRMGGKNSNIRAYRLRKRRTSD